MVGLAFDAVGECEVGAGVSGRGVGEFGGEGGEGSAAPGGGGGVEADVQGGADDLQVSGQGECFAEQCSAFVFAAGVVRAQEPGQGGLGVVGAHPDRVGQELAFGLQEAAAGPDRGQRQMAGRLAGGVLGRGECGVGTCQGSAGCGIDGGCAAAAGPAGRDGRGVDRGGDVAVCGGDRGAGGADLVVGAGLGGVGDQPVGVVGLVGVAVRCVQGEVLAGVFEVVLLAPPVGHPVGDLGGGQVGAVGQDRGLVSGGAGPHDQPQRQGARGPRAGGGRRGSGRDRKVDAAFGELVAGGRPVGGGEVGGGERGRSGSGPGSFVGTWTRSAPAAFT